MVKQPKYTVRCRDGNIVGLCDDYEGFKRVCLSHSPSKDISFPHNSDRTSFKCTNACNETIYTVVPFEK